MEASREQLLYESLRSRVVRIADNHDTCILKILNRSHPDPADLARFRREHALTCAVTHISGVIRCLGMIRYQESLALRLEDIDGLSLDRSSQIPLSMDAWLTIAIDLAATLARLHHFGVVHRDINPANVIWNPDSRVLRLIDFGLAERLPEQGRTPAPLTEPEGTLAFLSPEQTGRMNRVVDTRSDLYSLGATLHFLACGQPPFVTLDPLNLIADHLAKLPISLNRQRPEIPEMIARIVLKLLAKEPDERYQSARSLEADLMRCRHEWTEKQTIPPFDPDASEQGPMLHFPLRLIGRKKALNTLLTALRHTATGARHLVWLTGPPGSGKSALGHALRQPVMATGGRFAHGKFDQLTRERPMAAILDLLSDLLRQRQADPDPLFQNWLLQAKQILAEAVAILATQLPDLKRLFPDLPPVTELPSPQAGTRFRQAIMLLLQSLAPANAPLVLLLDDLQWADTPFLELLTALLTSPHLERLLIVATYRDQEVPPSHPLVETIALCAALNPPTHHLALPPLSLVATREFLAECLQQPANRVGPLALALHGLSRGNPLHLRTLLAEVQTRRWLYRENNGWQWDLLPIQTWQLPESVPLLLKEKIRKLPLRIGHLLACAACLGHSFDRLLLASAAGRPLAEVIRETDELQRTGFLLPSPLHRPLNDQSMAERSANTRFRFTHDRVQEAAIAWIPEDRVIPFRLEMGRRLLASLSERDQETHLFAVAEQFLEGSFELLDEETRLAAARLLLAAGNRARDALALQLSQRYLTTAMAMLGENGWSRFFDLSLALRHAAAATAATSQDLEQLETLRAEVTSRCPDFKDHLPLLIHLPMLYLAHSRLEPLHRLCADILRHLDYPMPLSSARMFRQINEARRLVMTQLAGRTPLELAGMPTTTQPDFAFISRWLLPIFMGLYFSSPALVLHFIIGIALRMFRDGLVAEAAWYFIWLSINFAGGKLEEEMECALLLGETSRLLMERDVSWEPPGIPMIHMYNVFVRPWRDPLATVSQHILNQYNQAMVKGDQAFAGWSICTTIPRFLRFPRGFFSSCQFC
ncbi:MAG: AAA family ATPase [Magnetococcus sp. YQC-9]